VSAPRLANPVKTERTEADRKMTRPPERINQLARWCKRECPAALPTLQVLWACRRYHGPLRGVCWPTMGHIAYRIGRSRGTVAEHVRLLEAAGLVQVLVAGCRDRPNLYLLWGFTRPSDDDLADELVTAWRLEPGEAEGILETAQTITKARVHRRRQHPTARWVRTCRDRGGRTESTLHAGGSPPLRPGSSAQARPRPSAHNPAMPGYSSTRGTPCWQAAPSTGGAARSAEADAAMAQAQAAMDQLRATLQARSRGLDHD